MPKITEYTVATELTDDTVLMGVQGGEVKQIPADKVGGGERWEDITRLFTPSSYPYSYSVYNGEAFDLSNTSFRITVELAVRYTHGSVITGTTQLYATRGIGEDFNLLTNTIYNEDATSFTGRLTMTYASIVYEYEVSMTEGAALPKIVKVERVMEV